MSAIGELKPHLVWSIFDDITRVPRPSKREEKIIAYLMEWATKHNIKCQRDQIGNVVMYKEFLKSRSIRIKATP